MLFVACIAFGVGYGVSRNQRNINRSRLVQSLLFTIFVVYCYLIIAGTLINRDVTNEPKAEWIPLWSWIQIFKGEKAWLLLEENLVNIVLFIPIGILLNLNWKINVGKAALIGLGSSIIIEVIQLITCRGLFQWDDILHNTLGCVIGVLIVDALRKIFQGLTELTKRS